MIHFLPKSLILRIHDRQLELYGGKPGILDEAKLDSALNSPRSQWHYTQASVLELAAAYGFHICKNHAFVKGNKRTASFTMLTFLRRNGYQVTVEDKEAYEKMIAVAKGEITQEELADWLSSITVAIPS